MQEENPSIETKKPVKKTTKKPSKPSDYKAFETLAKGILEGEGKSYYEWLHEKHKRIILNFNLSNKKNIVSLAGEDD